jgi:type IV pilus assembly protein PilZ
MGAALKAIEQRATRRLPIRVEVEYQTMEDFLLDYTANVSLGGVFIVTDSPLEVGTRFRLRLQIPHRKRPLDTLGEVRWVQDPDDGMNAGMGVQFDGMSGADRRAVERMIRTWEAGDLSEAPPDNVVPLTH